MEVIANTTTMERESNFKVYARNNRGITLCCEAKTITEAYRFTKRKISSHTLWANTDDECPEDNPHIVRLEVYYKSPTKTDDVFGFEYPNKPLLTSVYFWE